MSRETAKLLKWLESEKDSLVIRRLRALLETPNARVEPSSGLTALAGDLEPIYRVRNQIAMERKNTKYFLGLSQLASALQASSPSRKIQIRGVVGDLELGEIFFDAETNEIIGVVVITMSAHTRAYYRGELINDPTGATQGLRKPSKTLPRRVVKQKKVMA
jgi:hypothetical protein